MAVILGGGFGGPDPEESAVDNWLLLRLAVRSVAAIGLLVVLFVAIVHAFVNRYRRSTGD